MREVRAQQSLDQCMLREVLSKSRDKRPLSYAKWLNCPKPFPFRSVSLGSSDIFTFFFSWRVRHFSSSKGWILPENISPPQHLSASKKLCFTYFISWLFSLEYKSFHCCISSTENNVGCLINSFYISPLPLWIFRPPLLPNDKLRNLYHKNKNSLSKFMF